MFGCENYTDQKFHNFYRVCYNFCTIYGGFSFFQLHRGNRSLHVGLSEKVEYLTLNLLKCFLLWTIRKQTTILDLPKKYSKTKEASVIKGPKLKITASILDLLKILSEVIVAYNFFFIFSILYFTAIVIVYNSYTVQNNILIKIDSMVCCYVVEITNSYRYDTRNKLNLSY